MGDREKWDRKYREGTHAAREAEPVLQRALDLAEPGHALDVACGRGRHAIALARAGFTVDAIDVSAVGLASARERAGDLAGIRWIDADVLTHELTAYDLIVCVDFTDEALFPRLLDALRPGGWLVYAGRPRARCRYGPQPGDVARWFAALEAQWHHEDEERVEFIGRG
ncbi:MAG: class I SAM-dependent methyltransferase [Planctomycetota bacterium]|nr:class I SAM-dependent methyltransferase [Planctomycetota bacterium]